ncbi:MAG TPA: ABC transporter substrate-binding protein [Methyloversatilis sp.]
MRARLLITSFALVLLAAACPAQALEKVVFATNWKAQAEHGGYYQALADGSYRKCGLDVDIVMGGPSTNNRPLLPVGKIDFLLGGNLLQAFDMVRQKIPTVVVAAHFQKDPQGMLAHPGQGYERFEDLARAPVLFISAYSLSGFYQWMKSQHGFREEQVRPYNFSLAPFLANRKSAQQGLLTSEAYSYEKETGTPAKFFLLADYGWSTYSNTVETRQELVEKKPQVVQCFVDASARGWVSYLYGDNRAANALIRKANPDMTDDLLDFSVRKMKEYGIVDSGDTLTKGVGALSESRIRDFHDKMVKAGLLKPGEIDVAKSFTTRFVNRGAGLDAKKALTGK